MSFSYSPSTGNFYNSLLNTIIPTDAIAIAQAQYNEFMSGISSGQTMSIDASGMPILVMTLGQAQAIQNQVLQAAYLLAIVAPVSYTSKGGITKSYQADTQSTGNLQSLLAAFAASPASLPSAFFWVAADNTPVPFTYADMQSLALVIASQGIVAFAHLQAQKALVAAATTTAAVQAINF